MSTSKKITLLCSLLILFSPLGIDFYLPAFEIIENTLPSSYLKITDTLTIYLFMLGFGQLIFGPLSDLWGKKRIIQIGFTLTLLSCIFIIFAPSLEIFIFWRFIQGLGASALAVTSYSLIRDYFSGVESAKAYSIVNGCLNIIPTLAPFIGSFFIIQQKWQGIFIALFLFSLFVFAFILKLTAPLPFKARTTLHKTTFKLILKTPSFRLGVMLNMLLLTGIFTYVSLAPQILIDDLGLSPQKFGFVFGLNAAFIMLFSFLQSKILAKFLPMIAIHAGLFCLFCAGTSLLYWANLNSIIAFMLPILIYSIGFACISGIASAIAMSSFDDHTGKASALMGSLQMIFSSLLSTLLTRLPFTPKHILAYYIIFMAFLALFLLKRNHNLAIISSQEGTSS